MDSMLPLNADDAACPLCGQSNQCAMAQGRPAAFCWCMAADIAPAVLASLTLQARGQQCLCPKCAGSVQPSGKYTKSDSTTQ
ncbi:MAG: cysteine-rich CWC family protein [Giesbergeria sp.]|nr:cysteine-rich CWC family protein [Giesbergeria sp.]